jgi:hypothetical protein
MTAWPGCSFLVVILHDLRAAQLNELEGRELAEMAFAPTEDRRSLQELLQWIFGSHKNLRKGRRIHVQVSG